MNGLVSYTSNLSHIESGLTPILQIKICTYVGDLIDTAGGYVIG